jgi:putative ABC transport system substrate-binding protein
MMRKASLIVQNLLQPTSPPMHRRSFLLASLAGLVAAPLAAEAQTAGKLYRIVYLGNSSAALETDLVDSFRQGLRNLDYVEGRNIVIEYRWAEGRNDLFPALVAEAVRLKADVIVTSGTPATLAAKEATRTTPIVIAAMGDPISAGVVASLARPGGNITGLASMSPEIDGKRLELLTELLQGVSRIAVLWNPTNPANAARLRNIQHAAAILRLTLEPVVGAADSQALEKGFQAIVAARAQALVVEPDRALLAHRVQIVAFTARRRLPTLYPYREFVQAGGLVSYAPSYPAMFRRAATYVDKILKGVKPSDLPIEQPTTFELVINSKTAEAQSLTIPPSLLARADQVIE